jgi:hypothetical protein
MEKASKKIPTPRQRKAAQEVVKNLLSKAPVPTKTVLVNVGYGQIVQDPQRITGSDGFQQALQEIGLKEALIKQGINPKKIAEKISVLLEAKDNDEKPDTNAIDKGLKHATAIYGIDSDQPKNPTGNTYNFIFSPEVQNRIRQTDEEIKKLLTQSNV